MNPRRLILLRHAKSSWDEAGLSDHARPLNSRGRRAAPRIGHYLRREGISFDLVLCSSSTRTRETLALLELDRDTEILVEDELYGADADELLARLQRVPPRVAAVLLIGHNPGIQELAVTLTGEDEQLGSFPTAALADLVLASGSWTDLHAGGTTLAAFVTPRELAE